MSKMPKIVIVKETFDGWYQSPIIDTSSRRPVDEQEVVAYVSGFNVLPFWTSRKYRRCRT
jgi:hypothetical protein